MEQNWQRAVENFFSRRAAQYTLASSRGIWAKFRRRELNAVKAALSLEAELRVLEVGCGDGYYFRQLGSLACSWDALDSSPQMVAAARSIGLEAHLQDIHSIQLSGAYDRILAAGVLEFVQDPILALVELNRMCGISGKIVLLLPKQDFVGFLYAVWHRMLGCPTHYFSFKNLETLVDRSGLKIEARFNATPISHCLRLIKK
jgi:SAM-dependent methyltransferase